MTNALILGILKLHNDFLMLFFSFSLAFIHPSSTYSSIVSASVHPPSISRLLRPKGTIKYLRLATLQQELPEVPDSNLAPAYRILMALTQLNGPHKPHLCPITPAQHWATRPFLVSWTVAAAYFQPCLCLHPLLLCAGTWTWFTLLSCPGLWTDPVTSIHFCLMGSGSRGQCPVPFSWVPRVSQFFSLMQQLCSICLQSCISLMFLQSRKNGAT